MDTGGVKSHDTAWFVGALAAARPYSLLSVSRKSCDFTHSSFSVYMDMGGVKPHDFLETESRHHMISMKLLCVSLQENT